MMILQNRQRWRPKSSTFFAENALGHERTGEMIECIGLTDLLGGVGLEIEPEMIS